MEITNTPVFSYRQNNCTPQNSKDLPQPIIPENLSWQLRLSDQKFDFIGHTQIFGGFAHLRNISFINFIKLTKQPFMMRYADVLNYIISEYDTYNCDIRCEILLPIKLTGNYHYVKQTITLIKSNKNLYGIQIVCIPVKDYNNEPFELEVYTNAQKNSLLTKKILENASPPLHFTRQQLTNVNYIYHHFTCDAIASKEKKTKAAVHKLNRKILEKISAFFDFEFPNVNVAVQYLFKCFPNI